MKAIILAAGRGSRMKNLTSDRPKCLLEIDGTPLLDLQIKALSAAGISDIALVTGYRRELLNGRCLTIFHNTRWQQTNMVSSLECAMDWLEADTCIVSYSDIFYEASAVIQLMTTTADIAVTYDRNWQALWERRFGDPLIDSETFRFDNNGRLYEIGNKPKSLDQIQGQYMGLLLFKPAGWAEVQRIRRTLTPAERDKMHMTGTLQIVLNEGKVEVQAIEYSDRWGEVDSVEDLAVYQS